MAAPLQPQLLLLQLQLVQLLDAQQLMPGVHCLPGLLLVLQVLQLLMLPAAALHFPLLLQLLPLTQQQQFELQLVGRAAAALPALG